MAPSANPAPDAPLGLTEVLQRTPPGQSVFTTVRDSSVSAYARNAGVKVRTERLLVIHAASRTLEEVTKVYVLERLALPPSPTKRIRRTR